MLDTDADNKALDADTALQELGDDLVAFGYVTTTVTVCDEDSHTADEKIRAVERAINTRGFTTIRESVNAVEAWRGSLPGDGYRNVRRVILHTLNLADMMPITAVWAGEKKNPSPPMPVDAPSPLYAATSGATPVRFNLHVGDLGHTLMIGPPGAGKSTFLGLTTAQWFRYPRAQVFAFDKGYSLLVLTKT